MTIIIGGYKVYLRGIYARKYHTLKQLEAAKAKESQRWLKFNTRLAERIRTMPMLEWLNVGGAIFRQERKGGRK